MLCNVGVECNVEDGCNVGPQVEAENDVGGETSGRTCSGRAEAASEGKEDDVEAEWSCAMDVEGWSAAGSKARAMSRNIFHTTLV